MELIYLVLAIGIGVFIYRSYSRKLDDAEALEWATRREPLVFISEHAFDETVEARAAEARKRLREHGNAFLRDGDVWVYVYRVHVPLLGQVTSTNHAQWQDTVWLEVTQRREQWRQTKAAWIKEDAGRIFGNQKTATA